MIRDRYAPGIIKPQVSSRDQVHNNELGSTSAIVEGFALEVTTLSKFLSSGSESLDVAAKGQWPLLNVSVTF